MDTYGTVFGGHTFITLSSMLPVFRSIHIMDMSHKHQPTKLICYGTYIKIYGYLNNAIGILYYLRAGFPWPGQPS